MNNYNRPLLARHLDGVLIRLLSGIFAAVILVGCSTPQDAPVNQEMPKAALAVDSITQMPPENETPWPDPDWATSSPKQQGMDSALLEQMQEQIREQKIGLHSLLIIRHGVIVSENYYAGYQRNQQHELYSVTKSFISTLVGIAVDQGKLRGVDQRVMDLLPNQTFFKDDAAKQAMTLENLLTMTSGLAWEEGDPTYARLYRSPNWVDWVLALPMTGERGQDFVYCSGCSHVLSAVLQQQTGMNTEAFADQNLFKPLGISDYRWDKDAQGIPIGGWGLGLTPRQMAKLGYLYLHEGNWNGQQIISSGWVKTATTRHITTGDRTASGSLNYGYQWWIYPTHNASTALGRGGQTIFVAPDQDLIVVTTADLPAGHDPIFDLIDRFILPAVQD